MAEPRYFVMTGGRDANEVMDRAGIHGAPVRGVAHRAPARAAWYGAVEIQPLSLEAEGPEEGGLEGAGSADSGLVGATRQGLPAPDEPRAHPFLKWAGGKRQLLPELLKYVPASFGTYHEPFLGGGALYFALAPRRARIGDVNRRLIAAYRALQLHPENLIPLLREAEELHARDGAEWFYRTRGNEPTAPLALAVWFIALNKTGFNGLWRVNKSDRFNVPYGKFKNPTLCDVDNLRACAAALRAGDTMVLNESFEAADRAVAGDFVYFDPPYVPLSDTSSFTGYAAGGFGPREQERLRDLALKLKRRGVYVLLSNSSAPAVGELYGRDFELIEVSARRGINSKADRRGSVTEYLIR